MGLILVFAPQKVRLREGLRSPVIGRRSRSARLVSRRRPSQRVAPRCPLQESALAQAHKGDRHQMGAHGHASFRVSEPF
ncbi:hypothetical protein K523DRAFT_6862 [Schizophyllum commune Tattone D]|nr:hypothetical protein K523DRAFT_6862 [Schizophyllum commune Tattone D]